MDKTLTLTRYDEYTYAYYRKEAICGWTLQRIIGRDLPGRIKLRVTSRKRRDGTAIWLRRVANPFFSKYPYEWRWGLTRDEIDSIFYTPADRWLDRHLGKTGRVRRVYISITEAKAELAEVE